MGVLPAVIVEEENASVLHVLHEFVLKRAVSTEGGFVHDGRQCCVYAEEKALKISLMRIASSALSAES
eukprot:7941591-Alexandrium_andersonii.AAC.1